MSHLKNQNLGNIHNQISNLSDNILTSFDDYDARDIHLYFDKDFKKLNLGDDIIELIDNQPRKIITCTAWSELASQLNNNVKSICFAETELENSSAIEIVNMVNTLRKLVSVDYPISITVAITKNTQYSTIKLLQQSNIQGIIPIHTDFGINEAVKGCEAQWATIPYWPKHIIKQLPGYKCKKIPNITDVNLTPRQKQVFSMVAKRGATNKIIAKTLNIAESTVKLHMGAILRKYGLRNRTQLAVFAKDMHI